VHIVYGLIEDYRAALARLRPTVRAALEGIIGEVRQQAYYQNDVLAQDGLLEKTLIYTGAFLDGLYSGASHTAEMAWRLVSDSASRVEDIARTAWQSLRAGDIEHLRGQLLLLARHLGLAAEQAARMAQDAALILSDSQLRGMLEAFPEDYFAAHNSVAKVHMLASLGMQLLTLIFIGVATDGAGAAAQALGEGAVAFTASGEFATLAQALREAVAVLEKIPLARALDALAGQRIDTVVEDEAGAVVGTAARDSLGTNADFASPARNRILRARQRQIAMLDDNVGFNVSPLSWDDYPTIGRNGTYISDRQGLMDVIGDFSGNISLTLDKSQIYRLEEAFGLERGSLQEGFKIRQIDNIIDKICRSPLEGNQYFQGAGNHLPGGAPEIVINSIPTLDTEEVTTLLKVLAK